MFAFRIRKEIAFRALLIVALLCSALGPTTAAASSSKAGEQAASANVSLPGAIGVLSSLSARTSRSSRNISPKVVAADIQTPETPETPTLEPSLTPTGEGTLTPDSATPSLTPEASSTATQTFVQTATENTTATATVTGQSPALSFRFSASPEQAAPGDIVTFTVTVINQGQTPATDLLFSNSLPVQFGNDQSSFKDFNFDPQTRLLTWGGAGKGGNPPTEKPVLLPGETLTLQYTIRMDAQLDETQIIDTATFTAEGFSEPLLAEAKATVLSRAKQVTMIDSKGGKAIGLDGRIELNLPEHVVEAPRGIVIQALGETEPMNTDQP